MNLITRNTDASVEKITNGYIVVLTGRDSQSNYKTEKLFLDSMQDVSNILELYFKLKED